jgi:hypothetical protein
VASWHAPRFPRFSPWGGSDASDGGPVLPSARIESLTAVRGPLEVRINRLVRIPPNLPVRLSGWAAAAQHPRDIAAEVDGTTAVVVTGDLRSTVAGLYGWDAAGTSSASYGTAYGDWAVVPELLGTTSPNGTVYVAMASLSGVPVENAVGATIDGGQVTVEWDDTRQVFDLDSIFAGIR